MIESTEPLFFVIWAVFAFAAGLYPLGFMLGSPCSPCCGSHCDDAIEFNRCIRFVNKDTTTLETTFSNPQAITTRVDGYSRAVSRPEQVGLRRVPTEVVVHVCKIVVSGAARGLPLNETQTATYRVTYDGHSGAAIDLTVKLMGVAASTTPTPPVFTTNSPNNYTYTIYSDNFTTDADVTFETPSLTARPVNDQMFFTRLSASGTDSQYITASFWAADQVAPYTEGVLYSIAKYGYVMLPTDPFALYGSPVSSDGGWIYDTDLVAGFISGDSTVDFTSSGSTFTMKADDPTKFCGVSLCADFKADGDPVKRTVTFQRSKYSSASTEPCHGQDVWNPVPLRRYKDAYGNCHYKYEARTCQAIGYWGWVGAQIDDSAFYCGDLLWVLENGPCRNTVTIEASNLYLRDPGVFTLGGDDDGLFEGDWMCPSPSGNLGSDYLNLTRSVETGKCPPPEITVEIAGTLSLGNINYNQDPPDYYHEQTGTFVLDSNISVFSGYWQNEYFGSCNSLQYSIPNTIRVTRTRDNFCSQWTWNWNALGYSSLPIKRGSSGTWEYFTPVEGTDFIVTYEEVDPIPTSVTPKHSTVPQQGGTVTLTRCCPDRQDVVEIGPNNSRWKVVHQLDSPTNTVQKASFQIVPFLQGRGATAYITQDGLDQALCPFSVLWVVNSTLYEKVYTHPPIGNGFDAVIIQDATCPMLAEIVPNEQPSRSDWTVETNTEWLVVEIRSDGLVSVSIKDINPPTWGESFAQSNIQHSHYYTFEGRHGVIKIKAGGSEVSWNIIQTLEGSIVPHY